MRPALGPAYSKRHFWPTVPACEHTRSSLHEESGLDVAQENYKLGKAQDTIACSQHRRAQDDIAMLLWSTGDSGRTLKKCGTTLRHFQSVGQARPPLKSFVTGPSPIKQVPGATHFWQDQGGNQDRPMVLSRFLSRKVVCH